MTMASNYAPLGTTLFIDVHLASHWLWAILYTLKAVDKSALEGEWMDVGMNIFIYKMNGLAIKKPLFLAGHLFFFSRLWLQF